MAKAKKVKELSGSIKISPQTHALVKEACGKMLNVGAWCDEVLKNAAEKLMRKQDELVG